MPARHRTLCVLLPLAVLVGACGSDEDSASDTALGTASPPATDAEAVDGEREEPSSAEAGSATDAIETDATATDAATEPAESTTTTVEEPAAEEASATSAPAESDESTDAEEPAVGAVPDRDRPASLEGQTVNAFGSNVWPVVEDLLVVGIAPDVIVRNEGSQDAPGYLTDRYGDEIAAAELMEMNLLQPSVEAFAAVGGDVLAVPGEFEPFLPADLLALFDTVIFTRLDDWRTSVGSIVENAGADPEILNELDEVYEARVVEVQSATGLDTSSLTISTFSINGEQVVPDSRRGPGVTAAIDVGLQPVDVMQDVPNREQQGLSLEEITQLDADLVFYNVRSQEGLDELLRNPLWQQTSAFANETPYPGVSEWRQSGYLGTLSVLNELEAALIDYEAKGLG